MPAALLKSNFSPNLGRDRSTVTELWHVYDILGWSSDNTTSVVFGQIPYDAEAGTPHPDVSEATCRNMVLRQRWTDGQTSNGEIKWQAIVAVYFDSASRQSVFNPRSRTIDSFVERFKIPFRYKILSPAFGSISYYEAERVRVRRIETRYARTAQVTPQQENIMYGEAGKVYYFGIDNGPIIDPNPVGVPFLFKGPNIVSLSNGLTSVSYVFDTTAPIAGLPSRPTANGMQIPSVNTPPLGYLDEYINAEFSIAVDAPILVSPWQDRYVEGEGLPFL